MANKRNWITSPYAPSAGAGNAGNGPIVTFNNANNKKSSSKKSTSSTTSGGPLWSWTPAPEQSIDDKVADYAALLDKYGIGSGGGGGGGYSVQRIDLTPTINALTNAANAQKNTLQVSADNQRTALLDSIKRFQEQTARSQQIQRDSFNSSRADLEEASFQADRSNRISAAARGIGGSGLQQLAQLQTLIEQNNSLSDLAKENTNVQTELAKNLSDYEKEANTNIQNILSSLAAQQQQIDADLGTRIADLQYQEDVRYENARQQAAAAAASSASNARNAYAQMLLEYELGLREQEDVYSQYGELVKNLQSDFSDQVSSITNKSKLESKLNDYKEELYGLVQDNLIPNKTYSSALGYLNNIYNNRLNEISSNQSWLSRLFS